LARPERAEGCAEEEVIFATAAARHRAASYG
jgi:hypothetical protein